MCKHHLANFYIYITGNCFIYSHRFGKSVGGSEFKGVLNCHLESELLSLQLFIDKWLFQFLILLNNAAMNVSVCVLVHMWPHFSRNLRYRISGQSCLPIFSYTRKCHMIPKWPY